MNEVVNDIILTKAIECYELMDQIGLLRMMQAFDSDIDKNINTEEGVVFASIRQQIIDGMLKEREEQWKKKINGYKKKT